MKRILPFIVQEALACLIRMSRHERVEIGILLQCAEELSRAHMSFLSGELVLPGTRIGMNPALYEGIKSFCGNSDLSPTLAYVLLGRKADHLRRLAFRRGPGNKEREDMVRFLTCICGPLLVQLQVEKGLTAPYLDWLKGPK